MVSHRSVRSALCMVAAAVLVAALAGPAAAQDTRVSIGSPPSPFSQNKQNEPARGDRRQPSRTSLVAGANDNIDMEACNAGADNDCPFTPGVGVSGVYFSFDSGAQLDAADLHGLTRPRLPRRGRHADPECIAARRARSARCPNYSENGLVSDGDPAVAFGPRPDASGGFSWANGSRLYYANLTSALPGHGAVQGLRGDRGLAHRQRPGRSGRQQRARGAHPVIASKQNSAIFSDKEQIWADNAASSPFFGNVYVCCAAFRGNGNGFTNQPLFVAHLARRRRHLDAAARSRRATNNINSRNGFGRSGCTVRTDSPRRRLRVRLPVRLRPDHGCGGPDPDDQVVRRRRAPGRRPRQRRSPRTTRATHFEPVDRPLRRWTASAARAATSRRRRPSTSPTARRRAPTPPTGIVMTWVDGRDGLNNEHVMFSHVDQRRRARGRHRVAIERGGRSRLLLGAGDLAERHRRVARLQRVHEPFKDSAIGPANDRPLVGVVLHADVARPGRRARSRELHRGAPGDARARQPEQPRRGVPRRLRLRRGDADLRRGVWNDVRNAADCPAIDAYRQALHDEAVATGAADRRGRGAARRERGQRGGRGRRRPGRTGGPAGVPSELRQLGHLRLVKPGGPVTPAADAAGMSGAASGRAPTASTTACPPAALSSVVPPRPPAGRRGSPRGKSCSPPRGAC